MKERIKTFILFLIMMALIIAFGMFAIAIYFDLTSEDIIEAVHTSNSQFSVDDEINLQANAKKEKKNNTFLDIFTPQTNEENDTTYKAEESEGKYFYEQLNDTQKIIYNGLQSNKDKMLSGTYVIQYGEQFSNILESENGSERLGEDYQSAVEAYSHDNPDLFYLDINKLYLNIETSKKAWSTKYNVYIGPKEGTTYFNSKFTSELEARTALNQIEAVKNNVLSKLTSNEYKNIKIIHDYLIDTIEYDVNFESPCTYSIYGALIDGKCVCEGYARSFKYLANAAGIKCELVQGVGINSNGQKENHAWNVVYLNDKWYYVDCTWDDPIIIGNGMVLASTNYRYFLKGTQTFDKDHTVNPQFSEGGKEFTFPTVSSVDY